MMEKQKLQQVNDSLKKKFLNKSWSSEGVLLRQKSYLFVKLPVRKKKKKASPFPDIPKKFSISFSGQPA